METYTREAGLSLIELLVSMVIAGIIFAGVLNVVVNSRSSFVNEEEVSFIQENIRFARDVLSRDIRMAGNMGCAMASITSVVNAIENDVNGLIGGEAIVGFEGTASMAGFPEAFRDNAIKSATVTPVGSDAMILRYADPDTVVVVDGKTNPASATIKLKSKHSFSNGQILMIVDGNCSRAGIFRKTAGNDTQINHNTGKGSTPGNCTHILRAPSSLNCQTPPGCGPTKCGTTTAKAFNAGYDDGSTVMSFVSNAYYVGQSVHRDMTALKRTITSSTGDEFEEELVEGVERMELQFGSDSDADGVIDVFLNANDVTDWNAVLAVRFSLLIRSRSEVLDSAQQHTYLGTTYNDRYMRQLVSSTVKLRNRGGL